MIGKKDWSRMARQIFEMEMKMHAAYNSIAPDIQDPIVRQTLEALARDEMSHGAAIAELFDRVENQ